MNIKFSIGIPAYKARYLNQCINSILAQTNKDFELIIVNDASPEDIDSIINQYKDKRIRYYKNDKNYGAINVVDNWNKCLSFAKGEYFVLMGDDDVMQEDYLDEFNKLIEAYPQLDVYHCRSYIINETSEKIGLTPCWAELESVYDSIFHRMKYERTQFISDFVYRSTALKQNGGFYKLPLAWRSDDVSSYIAMGAKGIAHTNRPVFCYRKSSITISNSGSSDLKLKALELYKDWLNLFLKQTPTNACDLIIRQNIADYCETFMRKNRIYTIAPSMQQRGIVNLFKWYRNRHKHGLTIPEIGYAYIEIIKRKLSK